MVKRPNDWGLWTPLKGKHIFFPQYEQCGLEHKILTFYSFMCHQLQHSEILRHAHTERLGFVWT